MAGVKPAGALHTHPHTSVLFLKTAYARLPSIALAWLKIINKQECSALRGRQRLRHKNQMEDAQRKGNYRPLLCVLMALMEFTLTR